MQTTRALVCRAPGAPLRRTQLEREFVLGLATSGLSRGVEVYVLPQESLDLLADALPDGAMVDRGVKHHAKALAEYFARKRGLLRVRANYHLAGQAERGIRALVSATAPLQVSGRYFVGVPAGIFDALWERAPERPGEGIGGRPRSAEDASRFKVQELLGLHPELEIPDSVRRSFIGDAPVVRLVHYLIVLAAHCRFSVLIEGETGTGKEVVARQIHRLQFGRDGKCISVNCSGIPSELLESELFGHVRGAFTSATRDKIGLWQDAHNGTLFLDEIGDLTLTHQAKLLRAIEHGEFLPVGGVKPFKSNARVLSATHRNLEAMVRSGHFREDLYHRLVVLRVRTPALREHPEDIPAIARHLWTGIRLHKSQVLPDEVAALLEQQPLPGNVRELRSILSGIAMVSYGKSVTLRMARIVLRDRGVVERDG
jgi:hypothetical protein